MNTTTPERTPLAVVPQVTSRLTSRAPGGKPSIREDHDDL